MNLDVWPWSVFLLAVSSFGVAGSFLRVFSRRTSHTTQDIPRVCRPEACDLYSDLNVGEIQPQELFVQSGQSIASTCVSGTLYFRFFRMARPWSNWIFLWNICTMLLLLYSALYARKCCNHALVFHIVNNCYTTTQTSWTSINSNRKRKLFLKLVFPHVICVPWLSLAWIT